MGVPIYDYSLAFNTLRQLLEASEAILEDSEEDKYVSARTWALYIGAMVERGTRRKQAQSNRQWFNRTLVKQVSKIRIFT